MPKLRVLVVEDDPMVAEVNGDFVKGVSGFELAGVAHSGRAALEKIRQLEPDLVLLDVFLPDISGVETLREIRRLNLPVDVIMVTAAHDADTIQSLYRYGATDYIVKPFKYGRLKSALEHYARVRISFGKKAHLNQEDLDRLALSRAQPGRDPLPKGLNEVTLKQIHEHLLNSPQALSAEEVAGAVGLARVTARRYLDYLEKSGKVSLELQYGSVGRPISRYRA
ncbi:MAG: response regulator [Firmicutes bacterium]|nr:response regulator [Bacillota bacterium]